MSSDEPKKPRALPVVPKRRTLSESSESHATQLGDVHIRVEVSTRVTEERKTQKATYKGPMFGGDGGGFEMEQDPVEVEDVVISLTIGDRRETFDARNWAALLRFLGRSTGMHVM